MDKISGQQTALVFSYLAHRKSIGILGMVLPFAVSLGALLIFGTGLQTSISAYYYTGMRDVLVGTLFAIGFFLLSYKGYDCHDRTAGVLGFVFALGVALFPTVPDGPVSDVVAFIGWVHVACAALFFMILIFFSLFLFTKTDETRRPTRRKLQRNAVYQICGCLMVACLLLMGIFTFLPETGKALFAHLKPIYWLEALAILAFGVSWFVKGEAILKDDANSSE